MFSFIFLFLIKKISAKAKQTKKSKMLAVVIPNAVLLLLLNSVATDAIETFKAAVYGHAVILPENTSVIISRQRALANMEKNLAVYAEQAKRAKQEGAEILVFPEDGLYGFTFTRETIFPYLEYIPDPRTDLWSPCSDPDRYPDTHVQRLLSCMAQNNGLYIVANMGDKRACDVTRDRKCPPDGRYQYNTNVVFGPDGTLLARYHKYHLFYETQFDVPELELIYFDTPFGRFGLMVCFDVLFHEPVIPLIETMNVSNIVFSTAWIDSLPLLSALGFHSSLAPGLGINFLSANIHRPDDKFHGSGIYGPNGAIEYYYGSSNTEPKLLVADVRILGKYEAKSNSKSIINPKCGVTCEKETEDEIYKQNMKSSIEGSFQSLLYRDLFTFVTLDKPSGKLQIGQKSILCNLDYSISEGSFGQELFAFGAFDGLHTNGPYYFQICTLVKCADPQNRSSCGAKTPTSRTYFTKLSMTATLLTQYIYPQILLSDRNGELRLAKVGSWTFTLPKLNTNEAFNDTIHSAALFGRLYSRDTKTDNVNKLPVDKTQLVDFSGNSKLSSNGYFVFIFGVALQLLILILLLF